MGECCVRDAGNSKIQSGNEEEARAEPPARSTDKSPLQSKPARSPQVQLPPRSTSALERSKSSVRSSLKMRSLNTSSQKLPSSSQTFFPSFYIPIKLLSQPFEELFVLQDQTMTLANGVLQLGLHATSQTTRIMLKLDRRGIKNEPEYFSGLSHLARFEHPYVFRAVSVVYDTKAMYVLSDCIDTITLVEYGKIGKLQSESVVRSLAIQLLSAISYLHAQNHIIRALSLLNLFFYKGTDDVIQLKLVLFGNERTSENENSFVMFTPPEVQAGHFVDKSNIWSCGVILYILLTNTIPFRGTSIEEVKEEVRDGVRFSRKVWERVDPQVKALISWMVMKDPRDRPSASECLAQPWLQRSTTPPPAMQGALSNLRRFKGGDKLRLSLLMLIVNNTLDLSEKQPLEDVFTYINSSGSGTLSIEELSKAFAQLHIPELSTALAGDVFRSIDLDNNGSVDFPEFLTAAVDYQSTLASKRLKAAFDLLDLDSSGLITTDEFKTMLQSPENEGLQKLLREVDRDGDGSINYREFCRLVKTVVGQVNKRLK